MKNKWMKILLSICITFWALDRTCYAQAISRNLLRNSTFQKQTNKGLPDYWDLHHAAAVTFPDLHNQYGIDEAQESPVHGTKVLRIINSEAGFAYLALWPTRFYSPLPPGEYTFSVYLRSSRYGAKYRVYKSWDSAQYVDYNLSTEWKRYTSTFRITERDRELQPMLYFGTKGSYYIAAPQLEKGASSTPFLRDADELLPETISAGNAESHLRKLNQLYRNGFKQSVPTISAIFDYDYYTDDSVARLIVSSNYKHKLSFEASCRSGNSESQVISTGILEPGSQTKIEIPLEAFPEGEFACSIKTFSGRSSVSTINARSSKRRPSSGEVRVNQERRFIAVNKQPFRIIGIATDGVTPEWYLKDLADHGFNTVFYTAPLSGRKYKLDDVKKFLDAAAQYRLKAIVGLPLAGSKPADWGVHLQAFCRLVEVFRGHPAVLGWFAFDEPAPTLWMDSDILEIYKAVKNADPYHLVLGNWDAIPNTIGDEPRGTLDATDIYSHDYYPFAHTQRSIYGFGYVNTLVARTAYLRYRPSHVFIQIYGNGDAWREPTGDELNFMTFFSLINGSMASYYDTKSNSKETWARMAAINANAKLLSTALFLDTTAREMSRPQIQGSFFYSVWKKNNASYAIVLNMSNSAGQLTLDVSKLTNDKRADIAMLFGSGPERLIEGFITDTFHAYEAKVYSFKD